MSTAAALSTEDETIVASFDTVLEAEMARGRLEVEGIPSRIVDGNTVGIAAHLSMALGGVKVVVAHSDLEAARGALFAPGTFEDPAFAPDAADEPAPPPALALTVDEVANRALRASVVGLIFVPPIGHLWSLWLLSSVWRKRAELSPKGRRQAAAAFVVDAVVCGGAVVLASLV